jgi:hypothetical protein
MLKNSKGGGCGLDLKSSRGLDAKSSDLDLAGFSRRSVTQLVSLTGGVQGVDVAAALANLARTVAVITGGRWSSPSLTQREPGNESGIR